MQQVKLFETFMQTQMFVFERENLKTKKKELVQVQGALRPVQLWEYVFPETSKDEVLTMLGIKEDGSHGALGMGKMKTAVIRKMLGNGVKPIGKYKRVKTNRYIESRGVAIYPIGIKKDEIKEVPEWNLKQEMI